MNSYDTHTRKPNQVHLTETDFQKALKNCTKYKIKSSAHNQSHANKKIQCKLKNDNQYREQFLNRNCHLRTLDMTS